MLMKKILIATGIYPPEIGGPATYAHLLMKKLPEYSIETELLMFRDVKKFPKIVRHIVFFFKIIFKGLKCDLIFSQDPVSTGLPSVLAGKLLGKKVVLRIAGDYAWEQASQRFGVKDDIDSFQNKKYGFIVELLRKVQSFSVRNADAVITPSNYFNKLVSNWADRRKKVETIYNGIDFSVSFEKKPKLEKTIITAGRLVPWKGFDDLIKFLKYIPEWKLMIAGSGDDGPRLMSMVEEEGLQDRVIFLGHLSRPELFEYIYRSNIFILLSKFESFSFQIVEAMHIGTPVIANDIGNISEIIIHERNGILLKDINPDNLVYYINLLEKDSDFSERMIENSILDSKKFSIDNTVKKFVSLSKELLENK